jgi:hypothetical protein
VCLGVQVSDELHAGLAERLGEAEEGVRVVDDQPQRVPAEPVLAEGDLDMDCVYLENSPTPVWSVTRRIRPGRRWPST